MEKIAFADEAGWVSNSSTLLPGQEGLSIAWTANVPFVSEKDASGFPSETIFGLPSEGIVMTAIEPRRYSGSDVFPALQPPPTLSQGLFKSDDYEGQVAKHVSRCMIDVMVEKLLLNIVIWFGTTSPTDATIADANSHLGHLVFATNAPRGQV